jgi:hypothetical protein
MESGVGLVWAWIGDEPIVKAVSATTEAEAICLNIIDFPFFSISQYALFQVEARDVFLFI